MDLEIAGNTALVTASSSGLGKASATALAREGVDVVINGRDESRLEDAVTEVREVATGNVIGQSGDITDPDDVAALVGRTVEEFGRLNHLVTSAGGPPTFAPLEAGDEDWYDAFDLLVMSVVRVVREASPYLCADGGGTIVNITSKAVKEGTAANVLSSSVRMSVVGFEKTLSQELAPEVRANAVLPSSHDTPRVRNAFAAAVERGDYESEDAALEARTQSTPLRRLADPMELGDTVAYLSSPRSGFINGEALLVDGGSAASTL
jgi:3-oxoacyl-[acyl-carrier protein] reductase